MIALVVFLVLPVLEIWTAILVAQWIGVVPTVLVLIGLSLLGVVLIRSEGIGVWRRANEELAAGRPPTETLLDGLMVVIGGLLLIVPGFLTAVPGLLLLFPPTRRALRPLVARWIATRAARSATIGVISFGGSSFGGASVGGAPGSTSGRSFGRWSGPVVDATGHVADGAATPRPEAYAEVVDVEVNRTRSDAPPALDPPHPS